MGLVAPIAARTRAMTMILLNKDFSDEQLSAATTADLRNVGKAVWQRLLTNCKANDLRLYHITLESLEGINALTKTERLALEWANKVERLDPVFQMSNLSALSVFDFPKLRDLTGIELLGKLTELNLSGNRGALTPPLHLTSIRPISRISNLASFSLGNAKLDDDDITPLAECAKLRQLKLSNQFDRKQCAYLAKRLNHQLENPIQSHWESQILCRKCNGRITRFTGRKMPSLCQVCDADRFIKAQQEFEALVREA